MWVRASNSDLGIDRRMWSPMCGALFAALLLDSDAALAGDELRGIPGLDGSAAVFAPVIHPDSAEPMPLAAPSVPPGVPFPTGVAAVPGPGALPGIQPDALAASRAALEDQLPIRLNARAVLSLNDLFLDPSRGSFPSHDAPLFSSSGPRIRRLEFGGFESATPEATPEATPRLKRSFSASDVHSGWLGEHIELTFNDGISYKENFEWRGMHLRLKIWGPMLKGDPGLGMRLRGFQWNGHPVEVRARATSNLQDLQVKIDF